jgi:hypothetical protein
MRMNKIHLKAEVEAAESIEGKYARSMQAGRVDCVVAKGFKA